MSPELEQTLERLLENCCTECGSKRVRFTPVEEEGQEPEYAICEDCDHRMIVFT